MSDMSDLRNFIESKLEGDEPEDADALEQDGELVDETAGVDEGEEADDAAGASDDDEEARAFWGAMTPEQDARARVDQEYADQLWAAWNAPDDEDGEVEGGDALIPRTPADIIELAYGDEDALLEAGFDSVEQFLVTVASDARYWLDVADSQGWAADLRPTARDLPQDLAMAVIAAGVPGAKVVADPLRRLRPGSPRRLW